MTDGEAIEDQLALIAKQLEECAAALALIHDDQPIDDERARFAMAAMQGLLADPNLDMNPEQLAESAVLYAIKLSEALQKQEEKERAAFGLANKLPAE